MEKIYLEIGSSVGSVLLFILLIIAANYQKSPLHNYAAYGNVAALLFFVILVGSIGIKLADIRD
jgi:hypothetical protein